MKKIYLFITLLFIIPTITSAQSSFVQMNNGAIFVSGNDSYVAGNIVNPQNDITGDFYAVGGMVNINKNIGQDLSAAGGTIIVSGNVGDDVRVVGGNVIIEGNIAGDLIIAGGQVEVKKGVEIGGNLVLNGGNLLFEAGVRGDAYINGGNLNFGGTVGGNAKMNIGEAVVYSGSKIDGNLSYSSKKAIPDLEKIAGGAKQFTPFKDLKDDKSGEIKKGIFSLIIGYLLYRFLFLVLFGSIIYFFFEKLFLDFGRNLSRNTGKSFLYGFLYFAAMPFAILFLFSTVIGIPVGLLFLAIYIFSFVFYKLVIVTVFSGFFINKFVVDKKSFWKKFGIIILVSLIITPLALIDLIIAFFAFGAIMQNRFDITKDTRK